MTMPALAENRCGVVVKLLNGLSPLPRDRRTVETTPELAVVNGIGDQAQDVIWEPKPMMHERS